MARLLLAGYFGAGNLGDDAILMGFLEGIQGSKHQVNVLASRPEQIGRNYGLTSTDRKDGARVKAAIQESDALIFPGGGIFQDSTSVQSAYYYADLVKQAKKAKKRVIMLAQGVGPLNNFLGKNFAVGAFNAADVLCVRDPGSAALLKQLGVSRPVKITADMAFLLPKPELRESSAESFNVGSMRTIGFNIRPFGKDRNKAILDAFVKAIQTAYDRGFVPTMIAMDEIQDQPLVDMVSKLCNGKVPELKGIRTPRAMQERIMRMEAVVSMRLHTGILAATVGVPSLMIAYDPKVQAFTNMMGYPAPLKAEGLSPERLCDAIDTFMSEISRTADAVERRRPELVKAAQGNIDALTACIG